MMARPVRLLLTGGTLDKIHDWREESLAFPDHGGSAVPEILAQGRCDFPVVEPVMQIDSLEMTGDHRRILGERIAAADEDALVVTHGTSTMAQTARYLERLGTGKTIVLTGAMRPHSLFVSDAGFNLGGAIIAAQILPAGVYGVMNGRIIAAADLQKDEAAGRFAD